jgi:hypothetical protein
MPSKVANGTSSSRFELPALNLNFGNITDGTDIPPPPDSPVEKSKPSAVEHIAKKPSVTEATVKKDVESSKDTRTAEKPQSVAALAGATNGNLAGTKRPADDIPPSPTVSTGPPGSLRRLLSRTLLSNSYAEGQETSNGAGSVAAGSRPPSRGGSSFIDERKSKRASGWFKRLRGGDSSKRSSLLFDHSQPSTPTTATNKSSGPPPPMIPELSDLEKDHGSLGGDLFKNIK